jgi:hypothetical protein
MFCIDGSYIPSPGIYSETLFAFHRDLKRAFFVNTDKSLKDISTDYSKRV